MKEQSIETAKRVINNEVLSDEEKARAIACIAGESCDGRHRFEPRYNKKPVQMMHGVEDAITYVCDVCIWCGKVVEPSKPISNDRLPE